MKKFFMGLVAALALSFAVPQNTDAARHRAFVVLSQDFYMRMSYDDDGNFSYEIIDDNGDVYMTCNNGRISWPGDTEWM